MRLPSFNPHVESIRASVRSSINKGDLPKWDEEPVDYMTVNLDENLDQVHPWTSYLPPHDASRLEAILRSHPASGEAVTVESYHVQEAPPGRLMRIHVFALCVPQSVQGDLCVASPSSGPSLAARSGEYLMKSSMADSSRPRQSSLPSSLVLARFLLRIFCLLHRKLHRRYRRDQLRRQLCNHPRYVSCFIFCESRSIHTKEAQKFGSFGASSANDVSYWRG